MKQKRTVLKSMKIFAAKHEYNPWEDQSFIDELDSRTKVIETGKVKGIAWKEVRQKARQSVQTK